MIKYIPFIVAGLFATTRVYSQCACSVGAGTGSTNGDYNNGFLTLPKKQKILEAYGDYRTVKGDVTHGNEHHEHGGTAEEVESPLRSVLISSIGFRYGISDKLTFSALLPYAHLQKVDGTDDGIGDLILLGTINVFQKNNFNIALQGGVELPTGIQKASNYGSTTVVVGSGSVDPMVGAMFSNRWDKLTLQGNALFKYTTPGFDKNYYGSISVHNVSLSYRLKGENNFCCPDSTGRSNKSNLSWSVFSGYYGEWLDYIKKENIIERNSGYYIGFATVGTNLSFRSWSFPLTVSLPVFHEMNGVQNDPGFRLRLGIIKSL